jgi:hypothetical protein
VETKPRRDARLPVHRDAHCSPPTAGQRLQFLQGASDEQAGCACVLRAST